MPVRNSYLTPERFGLSGFWMPGVNFFQAVDLIKKSSLKGFELVPADFQSAVGIPFLPTAGPWIRDIDDSMTGLQPFNMPKRIWNFCWG